MIHKAFVIMNVLTRRHAESLDAISNQTGYPRSTVHRIVKILQQEGVVEKTREGYSLTPKLLSMGLRGIAGRDMLDVAIPIVRVLSESSRETVSINVISGHERVCIYRIEGTQPITRSIRIGSKASLFRGAAGKVISAYLSEWDKERLIKLYVDQNWLESERVPALREELRLIKNVGYAMSHGERVEGSASIAVPLRDIMDHVVGSLSLATVCERFTPEAQKKFLTLLMDASREIQKSLYAIN